ncbi:recombination regulator RecX [Streptomyces sp. NPDC002851]
MTRRTEWPEEPAEPCAGYGDDTWTDPGRRGRSTRGGRARSNRGRAAAARHDSATTGYEAWGDAELDDRASDGHTLDGFMPDDQDCGSPDPSRAGEGGPRRRGREREADPAERARGIALRLLTGAPRTRKQLADALRKREIPDDVADEMLSRFEEVGLIDDSAFADAWVESRHRGRGLARRALARELRTKGVDSATIDEAMGQLDTEQEEATARDLLARKLRSTRGLDRDKRFRRLASFLARKGYPEGMALRLVREALEAEGDEMGEDMGELGTMGDP